MLRSWLHSDGMHFIGSYGQIHMSQMCEGIDQDGNKIKSRNVVVDGEITRMVADGEITQNRKFTGTIDIDGLPELDKVMPAGLAGVSEYDDDGYGGLYKLFPCMFSPIWALILDDGRTTDDLTEEEKEEWYAIKSGSAVVWIKDGKVAIEFHLGDSMYTEKYYIFYSDEEMRDIAEREKALDDAMQNISKNEKR